VAERRPEEGFLREALTFLDSLFGTTRQILRRFGPAVARPKADRELFFARIAVAVLNLVLRPFPAQWHRVLAGYEAMRLDDVSPGMPAPHQPDRPPG